MTKTISKILIIIILVVSSTTMTGELSKPELPAHPPQCEYKSLGAFTITHYCSCAKCCGKTNGITASGAKAAPERTIAMDKIDFGTVIIINDKEYIVEDRGGAIKGNKIDIYCASHEEALQKGKYTTEVFVKEERATDETPNRNNHS